MSLNKYLGNISVYFNKFWNGFLEGTNPNNVSFFIELFEKVFHSNIIIENNYMNADILCENACNIQDSFIYKKKWKYSIAVTGESVVSFGIFSDHFYHFSCFLSGLNTNISLRQIKFPLFISYIYCNKHLSLEPVDYIPKKMVCAIISNPKGNIRNKFLDKLEQKTEVVYGGSFRNNIGYNLQGDHNSIELINFMKQFKFVITMENNKEDYYITEKICNGFFSGIIPVYWGSPNIYEYFNSNRFLYLKDDSDQQINSIIERMINMDDTTYLNMIHSPILVNNDLINTLVQNIQSILF